MNLALYLKTYDNLQSLKELVSKLRLSLQGSTKLSNNLQDGFGEFYPIFESIVADTPNLTTAKYLDVLQESLDKIKVLDVTLAFVPSSSFIEKLSVWVNANVSTNVIIKVALDNTIVGGCILSFEGRYLDFTIKKRLVNLFEQDSSFSLN